MFSLIKLNSCMASLSVSLISCKDIIRLLYFKKKVAELEFNTAQLIFKEVESFHCIANEICFEVICRAILPSFP
jgi:hypothetical protein